MGLHPAEASRGRMGVQGLVVLKADGIRASATRPACPQAAEKAAAEHRARELEQRLSAALSDLETAKVGGVMQRCWGCWMQRL